MYASSHLPPTGNIYNIVLFTSPTIACNLLFSMKFAEGMGVVGNSLEVSRGVGGLPQIPEKGKSEGVVGSCMKLPLWWGMDIF